MNEPILVLLVCCLLPILCAWVSGYFRFKQLGTIDNQYPRLQNAQLTGAGARAVAAQQNAWEALAVYAAALLALNMAAIPVQQYTEWAWIFLVLRVIYALAYLFNRDIIRSLAFVGGYGICIYFFILAL